MNDCNTDLAKEFLDVMRTVSDKTFNSKNNIMKTALAVVIDAADSITPIIRLLNSPSDGSQDFEILNMSGESLNNGDSVWVNYWDGFTNAYMAVKNGAFSPRPHSLLHKTGEIDELVATDIGAMPFAALSTNLLINGGFDIWQRGTSFTAPFAYTADRWVAGWDGSGGTNTISRQLFTVGQTDVPNNPKYYLRWNCSVAGTGGAYKVLDNKIEDVGTGAGKTVSLSFWAKANAAKSISAAFQQVFGAGGSAIVYMGGRSFNLTTSWARYTATITLASIAGKTVGTSSYLNLQFAMPTNDTFTVEFANAQLNYGSVALPFVPRSYAEELRLCQRYYWQGKMNDGGNGLLYAASATSYLAGPRTSFPVTMRITPTPSIITVPTYNNCSSHSLVANTSGITERLTSIAAGTYRAMEGVYSADAEL